MISSGAFPKVTLSRPPIPGPDCAATSSVALPISAAVGITPRAAEKKTSPAPRADQLNTIAMGMKGASRYGHPVGVLRKRRRMKAAQSVLCSPLPRTRELVGPRSATGRAALAHCCSATPDACEALGRPAPEGWAPPSTFPTPAARRTCRARRAERCPAATGRCRIAAARSRSAVARCRRLDRLRLVDVGEVELQVEGERVRSPGAGRRLQVEADTSCAAACRSPRRRRRHPTERCC